MPSFRFCRAADIPLLVRAIDRCWSAHFPDDGAMSAARFRREMDTLDVQPSTAMVGIQDDEPIAVMIGTKRQDEVMILRLGVAPAFRRQGHGRRLLDALRKKLAIIGPSRVVTELPDDRPELAAFFADAGYTREATYTDWIRPVARRTPMVPDALVAPVTVDELAAQGLLDELTTGGAWMRRQETIRKSRHLLGVALIGDEVEAYALYTPAARRTETLDVLALVVIHPRRRNLLTSVLLRWIAGDHAGPVRLPRLADGEVVAATLERLGFVAEATHGRFGTAITPATP